MPTVWDLTLALLQPSIIRKWLPVDSLVFNIPHIAQKHYWTRQGQGTRFSNKLAPHTASGPCCMTASVRLSAPKGREDTKNLNLFKKQLLALPHSFNLFIWDRNCGHTASPHLQQPVRAL